MKFLTDSMLGKLSRWLRIAGHDVSYSEEIGIHDDNALISRALDEGRILLTSDVQLFRKVKKAGGRCFLIKSRDVLSQLLEISKVAGKKIELDFENSRCPVCNGELQVTEKICVKDRVPEKVFKSQMVFWSCKRCGKIYWEGKHWKNIIEMATEYNRRVEC
ncbi:MAG: Mut7-C RNAse domain-containing protein [Candidatus Hadarchaeales archaeon]